MNHDREFFQLLDEAMLGRLSRRDVLKRAMALGLTVPAISALLAACGSSDDETSTSASSASSGSGSGSAATAGTSGTSSGTSASGSASPSATDETEEGTKGGTLKIAMVGEPPTLDIHQTTGTIVSLIGWNISEPLFAWDENYKIIPMLAESLDTSSDGLTITLKLRKGVKFHNGEEMKAADVLASMDRWGGLSGIGGNLMSMIDNTKTVDDYTIEFTLAQPYGMFQTALALTNQGCAIYPKSVMDAAGKKQIDEPVGTGPYKFVEHQPDRLIRLERFDDYAALPGKPSGYGGHKYAYVDEIHLIPVSDEAARVAGLQAGDYDFPENVSSDQFQTLKSASNLAAEILPPAGWGVFLINNKQGIMTDLKIRQAFQACLDHQAICDAGYGDGFYRLDPSIMFKETAWYTDAGKELYNRNDPDTAKRLLDEAKYDGTAIRFTCTKQYQDHYNRSVVAKQQMEAVGFKVDLLVYDWATVLSQQQQPDKWDITTTGISFKPDPAQLSVMDVCHFAGWWCSPDTGQLVEQLRAKSDFNERFEIWKKIQTNFYNEVPMIKVGDALQTLIHAKRLHGLSSQTQLGPILWNTWLEK
jgi:peptide/nickel transport system substrate-binding protein